MSISSKFMFRVICILDLLLRCEENIEFCRENAASEFVQEILDRLQQTLQNISNLEQDVRI